MEGPKDTEGESCAALEKDGTFNVAQGKKALRAPVALAGMFEAFAGASDSMSATARGGRCAKDGRSILASGSCQGSLGICDSPNCSSEKGLDEGSRVKSPESRVKGQGSRGKRAKCSGQRAENRGRSHRGQTAPTAPASTCLKAEITARPSRVALFMGSPTRPA
jgi:hypothetical protein